MSILISTVSIHSHSFKRQESKYLKCVIMIVIYCEIVSLHFYFLQTSCTASEHTLITLHMISVSFSLYQTTLFENPQFKQYLLIAQTKLLNVEHLLMTVKFKDFTEQMVWFCRSSSCTFTAFQTFRTFSLFSYYVWFIPVKYFAYKT